MESYVVVLTVLLRILLCIFVDIHFCGIYFEPMCLVMYCYTHTQFSKSPLVLFNVGYGRNKIFARHKSKCSLVLHQKNTCPTSKNTFPTSKNTCPTKNYLSYIKNTCPTTKKLILQKTTCPTSKTTCPTSKTTCPTSKTTCPTSKTTCPTSKTTCPTSKTTCQDNRSGMFVPWSINGQS